MKNYFFIIFLFFLASCANKKEPNSGMRDILKDLRNSDSDYFVIPRPDSLTDYKKGKFQMNAETKIYTAVETISEAYYLLSFIKGEPNNIRYRIDEDIDQINKYGIYLLIDKELKSEEGYELKITDSYVKIIAKNQKGIFYGIQTLRQLMPDIAEEDNSGSNNKLITYVKQGVLGNNMTVPYCDIYDKPKFPFRGMQLDVSRHFFSVKFIKKYIDVLAMHKMNYFIFHLSDDQGWRVEIENFPKLTEVGSKRKETILNKHFNPYIADGKEYTHFYTKSEIREIVAYAEDRHISVIPALSFPGHASAILAAYPELGGKENYEVATSWGEFNNYLFPTSESLNFLKSVLREINELFPGEYIQINGLANKKSIQRKELRSLGFYTTNDVDEFFINNLKPWIEILGKKIIAKNFEGDKTIADSDIVLLNNIKSSSKDNLKNEIILNNSNHLNFAKYPTKRKDNKTAFGGYINTKDVYHYNEILTKLNIKGAEASLWTEYVDSEDLAFEQLLPRLSAFSEVLWTDNEKMDWFEFKPRFRSNLGGKLSKKSYKYSEFF